MPSNKSPAGQKAKRAPKKGPRAENLLLVPAIDHLMDRVGRSEEQHLSLAARVEKIETHVEEAARAWWMSWLEPAKPHAWKLVIAGAGLLSHRLAVGHWPSVPDFAAFLKMLLFGS